MQGSYVTRQREFDYLQLHWLEKTTGRPSYEWDEYIVKELLDNALDADERWLELHGGSIELSVQLHYRHNKALEITVGNGAPFPTEKLPKLLDLTAYTSNKSHYNYPLRGHQGNALKTILGIPYALLHASTGDYDNIRKPLTIETGTQSHVVSFKIDELNQSVAMAPIEALPRLSRGAETCVKVGMDRFHAPQPRTLAEIHSWAQRFALLNPHVTFHWNVRIGDEQAAWDFDRAPGWSQRFTDAASIQWYEYAQLRELLLAWERELGSTAPLANALKIFAGFTPAEDLDDTRAQGLCQQLGFRTLGDLHLTSGHARTLRNKLLPTLLREGRHIPAGELGCLGEEYLIATLTRFFSLQAPPLYQRIVRDDPADPTHPFVLEVVLGRLPAGMKRVIWTGLNHTPTYEDPFYNRRLYPPNKQGGYVSGLGEFLDAYGQPSDQPVLLVMHLICPNLAFQDFSKTDIDSRPFQEPLANVLHELLTALVAVQTVQFENLQPLVYQLIPQVVGMLAPDGWQRFTESQLLRTTRRVLAARLIEDAQQHVAEMWLADAGANGRLQTYIRSYHRDYPGAMTNLIQPEVGRLILPIHPDGESTLLLSQVDRAMLDEASINKILLVADPELQDLIIANRLLSRFDMALLQLEGNFDTSFAALLPHLERFDLPLVLLHHATAADCLIAEGLRIRLDSAQLTHIPLHDLGLTPAQGYCLNVMPEPGDSTGDPLTLARYLDADQVTFLIDRRLQMSLFSLTVEELVQWLNERFTAINLAPKHIPTEIQLRMIVLETIRNILKDWSWQHVHETVRAEFVADQVMQVLGDAVHVDDLMHELSLSLSKHPSKAWRALHKDLAMAHCQRIIADRKDELDATIRSYLRELTTSHTWL